MIAAMACAAMLMRTDPVPIPQVILSTEEGVAKIETNQGQGMAAAYNGHSIFISLSTSAAQKAHEACHVIQKSQGREYWTPAAERQCYFVETMAKVHC